MVAEHPDGMADATRASFPDRDIVEHLPDGVAVLENGATIRWANGRLAGWCDGSDPCGRDFFAALGLSPAEPGATASELAAIREALAAGRVASGTLRGAGNRFFEIQASAAFQPRSSAATSPTPSSSSRSARRFMLPDKNSPIFRRLNSPT